MSQIELSRSAPVHGTGFPRTGVTPRSQRGFTLIELMIVVAVVAILSAIAFNSYTSSMLKARRSTAQGCLTEAAQYMERYYSTNMKYDLATIPACSQNVSAFYTFSSTLATTTYTLRETPKVGTKQVNDSCGVLTINQVGTRTPTSNCW